MISFLVCQFMIYSLIPIRAPYGHRPGHRPGTVRAPSGHRWARVLECPKASEVHVASPCMQMHSQSHRSLRRCGGTSRPSKTHQFRGLLVRGGALAHHETAEPGRRCGAFPCPRDGAHLCDDETRMTGGNPQRHRPREEAGQAVRAHDAAPPLAHLHVDCGVSSCR